MLFPLMYYFIHPEAYRMRPLDPLIIILGCFAILALRERAVERKKNTTAFEAASILK
jgi:hypothetical protein